MPRKLFSNPKSALSKNLKVGVLLGGDSSERSISLKSGRAVCKALKRGGYCVTRLDPRNLAHIKNSLKKIDLAFIALHGRGGEDGKIQRFLESKKIAYVGSAPRASLQAFDKVVSKKIFQGKGIPTPPYRLISAADWEKKLSQFSVPLPYFFKPPCEGSSIGAFGVEDLAESAVKIRHALKRYGRLLVEKKIEGREFTVGILGRRALPVIELRPKAEFYDFRSKYTKGMTKYLVPAPISKKLSSKLQRLAKRTHEALGLRDFSRVDFRVDESGRPYVLEANSIPGFTELSLLPKAAKACGISFEELCSTLVKWAYKRKGSLKK